MAPSPPALTTKTQNVLGATPVTHRRGRERGRPPNDYMDDVAFILWCEGEYGYDRRMLIRLTANRLRPRVIPKVGRRRLTAAVAAAERDLLACYGRCEITLSEWVAYVARVRGPERARRHWVIFLALAVLPEEFIQAIGMKLIAVPPTLCRFLVHRIGAIIASAEIMELKFDSLLLS
jgi:hypothetical protein